MCKKEFSGWIWYNIYNKHKDMRKLLILFYLVIQSCGSYTFTTNTGYEVKSILAITEVGDTISVPYRQFVKYRDTEFLRYKHHNNWYWNNWRYNDPYFWNQYYSWNNYGYWGGYRVYNDRYVAPNRPYVRPKVKPKPRPRPRPRPRVDPREPTPRIRPNNPPRRVDPPRRVNPPRRIDSPRSTPTTTPRRVPSNTRRGNSSSNVIRKKN